jgi:hypothetical protein
MLAAQEYVGLQISVTTLCGLGATQGCGKREVSWGDMRVQRDSPSNNFATVAKRAVKPTLGTEVEGTFGAPGARKAAECPPRDLPPG